MRQHMDNIPELAQHLRNHSEFLFDDTGTIIARLQHRSQEEQGDPRRDACDCSRMNHTRDLERLAAALQTLPRLRIDRDVDLLFERARAKAKSKFLALVERQTSKKKKAKEKEKPILGIEELMAELAMMREMRNTIENEQDESPAPSNASSADNTDNEESGESETEGEIEAESHDEGTESEESELKSDHDAEFGLPNPRLRDFFPHGNLFSKLDMNTISSIHALILKRSRSSHGECQRVGREQARNICKVLMEKHQFGRAEADEQIEMWRQAQLSLKSQLEQQKIVSATPIWECPVCKARSSVTASCFVAPKIVDIEAPSF